MTRTWRTLTVWLHVLTSVTWMAQAMTMCLLLCVAFATTDPSVAHAAMSMSLKVDGRLVGPMADASAFTGFMLAAATPWGFFRHWWVAVKFTITVVQLYIGIFLLSPALAHAATAGPTPLQITGTVLMASAIAFQAWLSLAKPWGRIRAARPAPTAPRWIFVVAVAGTVVDLAVAFWAGHPMPLLCLTLLTVTLLRRPSWIRTPRRTPAPTTPV
ncbi:hypothetical protein [Actinoplanes sp. NPDC051851]|uniref:hypothetical protein n=1 Tax=Actinoplanes sp. NPDC051851 TaxID=3154753 RepID=UPI0034161976